MRLALGQNASRISDFASRKKNFASRIFQAEAGRGQKKCYPHCRICSNQAAGLFPSIFLKTMKKVERERKPHLL